MQINKLVSIFASVILFAVISTLPLSAQETQQNDGATETKNNPVEEKIVKPNLIKSEISIKSAFSKNGFTDSKNEFTDSKLGITDYNKKSENLEQQQDDDTMMGIMGKGSDRIKLGGHVGFVVPIVARGNGVTTNLTDRFVFGFPVGLTLKTKRNIAVDFEFIPTFNTGRDFVLTIHPGIIYGFKKKYAVGVRAAYDAGAGSFGLTPLISRGFKINDKVGFFIEADFPIRSNYRPYQDRFGSIAFAMHAGFAF